MEPDARRSAPVRHPSAWRRTIGALLRTAREARGLRLVDVAARARLSAQYLSEVERGRKEPSSEVLAAITAALDLTLVDLAQGIVDVLAAPVPTRTVVSLTSRSVASRTALPAPPSRATTLLAA
ncbi:MAG: helix-turn-helix transcriptional regulator [Cellulomonas sp.]|uniref:helix-turn-helix domain-containing protein n=1 Tax=Cellulomonas sp. TaxID=40001 RepID=UPI0019E44705|nr:helix-turn-helix transcriptional regulator [Cellulomonas sp.]MBF0689290.1 helix-turn-helix transcriptional regulator [Cellulomonas sp.]